MNNRACKKCGLIQLYDEIWGLCICDSNDALLFGCPPKETVLELRPDWKYDESAIDPPRPTWSYKKYLYDKQKNLIEGKNE